MQYIHTDNELSFGTDGQHRMRITQNGRVGIGTTSPSELVHCRGANASLIIEGTEGTNAKLILKADDGDDPEDIWQLESHPSGYFAIQSLGNNTTGAHFYAVPNGRSELLYDDSKKLETTSTGIQMEGSINLRDDHKVQLGNNQDLQIYHSSNVNFIDSSTEVRIRGTYVALQPNGGGAQLALGTAGGSFALFHNGNQKLETTDYGSHIDGRLRCYATPQSSSAVKPIALTLSSYTESTEEGPFMVFNSKWSGGYDDWVVGAIGGLYETQSPGGSNAGAIVFHTAHNTNGTEGLSGTAERMRLRGDGQLRVFHQSGSIDINNAAFRLIKTGGSVTDKTMISIENGNGTSGDLDYQSSNIDFSFFDTNTNVYPQVRIRANVGESSSNADSQVKEGRGWLSFHCSNTSNSSGEENPQEHFRIQHNGTLQGTDTSIGSLSDSRLKKNITDYSYSLDTFKQFKPKIFNWINPHLHGVHTNQRGFIAQDVESIDSYFTSNSIVDKEIDDYKLVPDGFAKTTKLVEKDAMYISVIQQLIEKVEKLETEVAALKGS